MEDDSNTGKGDKKIGSSSNPESSPTTTNPAGVLGQENVPARVVSYVYGSMRRGESSFGTGRANLSALLRPMRLPPGYGKGKKRKIDCVNRACSSDINPSSHMRRRLWDGSILEVERRPPPPAGTVLILRGSRSHPDHVRFGPWVASTQLPTIVGMSDPTFEHQHLPSPCRPGPSTIYEDDDLVADAATAPTSSSNDEMADADSDNMPESH